MNKLHNCASYIQKHTCASPNNSVQICLCQQASEAHSFRKNWIVWHSYLSAIFLPDKSKTALSGNIQLLLADSRSESCGKSNYVAGCRKNKPQ